MRAAIAAPGSPWWCLRLANLSTICREWAAVHSVAHMSLRDVLLTAKVGAAPGLTLDQGFTVHSMGIWGGALCGISACVCDC